MDDGRLAARLGSASPDLLAALVESVADAIYLVDSQGRVQFVNRAGLDLLGYDDETELLGAPSHATIHHTRPDGTPFPEADCPLLRPRETGETIRVEDDWFVRRDGTLVPVAYSSAPVAAADGRGAVVVFRDTSERRAAEAQRARADAGARVAAAADAERRRLGRDIHDGAQQHLVNVALATQLALDRLADDPEGARELLTQALDLTRTATQELRELSSGIHPAILTTRGLAAAVDALAGRAPIPVDLDVATGRVAPEIEAAAYFIVAEALTNVAKHADAGHATVTITADATALHVEIADDGRGGADPSSGRGLQGLADRAHTFGGTLTVTSDAGGTRVAASLPLPA